MLGTPPVGRHRLEPQILVRLNIFHLHNHVDNDAAYEHVHGDGAYDHVHGDAAYDHVHGDAAYDHVHSDAAYDHVHGDAAYDHVDGVAAQAGEPGRVAAGRGWSSARRPAFPIQPSRPPYKVNFIEYDDDEGEVDDNDDDDDDNIQARAQEP